MNSIFRFAVLPFTLFLASAAAPADSDPPAINLEGMELVEKSRRGEIYADPGVDWSSYSRIRLDPATVAFRRNWQRDQNRNRSIRVRADDMERIKSGLAGLFDEVFSEELSTNGGWEIVDSSADDVMRITPRIVDLDVYAPDTMSAARTTSFTDSAGRMTLKLEIYDSVTGDLIASASERREAPRRGYAQWSNSVTNSAEARRMLQGWAQGLRERLDAAARSGG